MSRVHFHSPGVDEPADLNGSEREWLHHIARGPAEGYWGLRGVDGFERAVQLVGMLDPDCTGYGDLRGTLEAIRQLEDSPLEAARARDVLTRSVHSALRVFDGLPLRVAGIRLRTSNVELNTALVCGSPIVALAAKLDGWCESHCWVEGPDRMWLADLIEEGLRAGVYRHGMWVGQGDGQPKRWRNQGWEDVDALLRARDDTPVVLSDSSNSWFPHHHVAGYADTADGGTPAQWLALSENEQWDQAMAGLRDQRRWARLAPDTLQTVFFHIPVTVLDLFAHDRGARVRRAAALGNPCASAADAQAPGGDI